MLCKNHDYEYDDEYLPLFDPSSSGSSTSNNCGLARRYSASTVCVGHCHQRRVVPEPKVRMVSVPVDEGNATGPMEKVTIDGCDYYKLNIYHCVGSTDTRAHDVRTDVADWPRRPDGPAHASPRSRSRGGRHTLKAAPVIS